MDFYNEFAKSLKGNRRFVMIIINLGLGYIEYRLVSNFIEVFNLYLRKNLAEELTFVIALGIIVLIVLITIVFYQWAVALVLIIKESIRSKEETGLRWFLGNSLIFVISLTCILLLIMIIVYILVIFLFNKTFNIPWLWEIYCGLYAIFLLYGMTGGLRREFKALKYKDNV